MMQTGRDENANLTGEIQAQITPDLKFFHAGLAGPERDDRIVRFNQARA